MKLWAHRGSHEDDDILENTLVAFQRAIIEGADGIELDVHLSADGVPVVFHDDSLERLTTVHDKRMIAEVKWCDLKRLSLLNDSLMPSLAETLDMVSGRLPINIEIKDPAAVHAVAHIIEQGSFGEILISSFRPDAVYEAAVRLPQLERAWISGDLSAHPIRAFCNWHPLPILTRTKATRWHTHGRFVRERVVSRLARRSIGTHVWTVNDPEQARGLGERVFVVSLQMRRAVYAKRLINSILRLGLKASG